MPDDTQQRSTYFGGQLPKGGGDWIGSNPYDIDAVMQSLPPIVQQAPGAAPRELDQPFAALRTLAGERLAGAELASVLGDIDTLQEELEKDSAADEGLCMRALQRIHISLPAISAMLRTLSQQPPLADRIGPNLRSIIDGLAAG